MAVVRYLAVHRPTESYRIDPCVLRGGRIVGAPHRFLHKPLNNPIHILSAPLSSSFKKGHRDSHVESTTRIITVALPGDTGSSFIQILVTASRYLISCTNRLRIIVAVSVLFSTGTTAVASIHSQDRVLSSSLRYILQWLTDHRLHSQPRSLRDFSKD